MYMSVSAELETCHDLLLHAKGNSTRRSLQDFQLSFDRRPDVQRLIGQRAELIAYVNCVMDRATLDACLDQTTHPISARPEVGGHTINLDQQQFSDLITVHLADWLEQVQLHSQSSQSASKGVAANIHKSQSIVQCSWLAVIEVESRLFSWCFEG